MKELSNEIRTLNNYHTEQTGEERAAALHQAAIELGEFAVYRIAEAGEEFTLLPEPEREKNQVQIRTARVDGGNVAISIVTAGDTTAPLYERADEIMARRA